VNNRAGAPQLLPRNIDLEIGEAEIQSFPRMSGGLSPCRITALCRPAAAGEE
jgi:hypothetical protein